MGELENWRRFDKAEQTIQQLWISRPNDSAMAMRHVYDDMLSRHLVGGIPTPMVVNGGQWIYILVGGFNLPL